MFISKSLRVINKHLVQSTSALLQEYQRWQQQRNSIMQQELSRPTLPAASRLRGEASYPVPSLPDYRNSTVHPPSRCTSLTVELALRIAAVHEMFLLEQQMCM